MPLALQVGADTFVTLVYSLFDETNKLVDQVPPDDALSYVHGYGQILPGLERALGGLGKGQKHTVMVKPEDGYGDYDEDAVFEVEKGEFPHPEKLSVGDEFIAESPDGELMLRVLDVRPDSVVVDGNHPLAGKTLRFEVEILDLRAATEEEIEEAEQSLRELEDRVAKHQAAHDHGDHHHHHGHDHDHDHEACAPAQGSEQLISVGRKSRPGRGIA
jgi:FKBP-type peptidyl-prolyl cis-trans isomerase SlyD